MPSRLPVLVLLLVAAFACRAADEPVQSQSGFEAAVMSRSQNPPYLAVTIVDASGAVHPACTEVGRLMGSLQIEYAMPTNRDGVLEVRRFILASTDHVFRLTNASALANIGISFAPADLATIRDRLRDMSLDDLRNGMVDGGPLHALYQARSADRHDALRDAMACVLIERGLAPEHDGRTDRIRLLP